MSTTPETSTPLHPPEPWTLVGRMRGSAFLVPADEYRSLQETVYLLRSSEGARRLRESLTEVAEGRAHPHDLIR